jgi:tetratricopeptide (TPR) repeat protein
MSDCSAVPLATLLKDAQIAIQAKNWPLATSLAHQAQQLYWKRPEPEVLLGTIEARSGKSADAIERFEALTKRFPDLFDPPFWLSVLERTHGRLERSLFFAKRAAKINPNESQAVSNLALTYFAIQDLSEAQSSFETAIQLAPNVVQNYEMLGKTLWLQGKPFAAKESYAKAAARGLLSPDSKVVLAQIAVSENRSDDAIVLATEVLQLDPRSTLARISLATALVDQGASEMADKQLETILRDSPNDSTALALVGMVRQSLGAMAKAKEAFTRSIESNPDQGLSYCLLVRSSKMESLLDSDRVNARGKSFLHFGLGKAYEDVGRFDVASEHFDRANEISYRLKFGDTQMDRMRLSSYVDWEIQTFNGPRLEEWICKSRRTEEPIFIVGMMRSGTTLVEQILSSHPEVSGAGERSFWLNRAHDAVPVGGNQLRFEILDQLAEKYLSELRRLFPTSPRITDKMPGNYRVVGQILAAFPKAKFIHTRRNPIDTCLSIYTTPNRVATEFAHNRENIVFAYQQYQRLMAHWEAVVGPHRMLTVDYETLVANPEASVRKMLQFCNLIWNDRCLRPDQNERSVITPSVWQVRQPVYTTSVERWRRYEPWLGAFNELRQRHI